MWVLGAVVVAFTLYVGLALVVALFHPDDKRRRIARSALRDLLDLFRSKKNGR